MGFAVLTLKFKQVHQQHFHRIEDVRRIYLRQSHRRTFLSNRLSLHLDSGNVIYSPAECKYASECACKEAVVDERLPLRANVQKCTKVFAHSMRNRSDFQHPELAVVQIQYNDLIVHNSKSKGTNVFFIYDHAQLRLYHKQKLVLISAGISYLLS